MFGLLTRKERRYVKIFVFGFWKEVHKKWTLFWENDDFPYSKKKITMKLLYVS
jgi:hypothetical protein